MRILALVAMVILLMTACSPSEVIVVTATPMPATDVPATETAIPPTATPTDEPTPTQENPTINENAVNPNPAFRDGCDGIDKFDKFAGRELCDPRGWDWNRLNFASNPPSQPPPDVMQIDNGADSYLKARIDYLAQGSQYCLAQYEYMPNADFSGTEINYVFKASLTLQSSNLNDLNRPSIELQLYTDNGTVYTQENEPQLDEKFIENGYSEYLWVIDPLDDVSVHYQFCFNFRGIQGSNNYINIHELAVLLASSSWGLDREVFIK
jgi:hypothetical protein